MIITEYNVCYLNIEKIYQICDLNENSLFIDLGANHGQQVGYLCKKNVETIAFEPHPIIYEKLIDNHFTENNKLTCYQKAAWIKDENLNLFFKQSPTVINGGASLIYEKTNICRDRAFTVECVDFSKFLFNLDRDVDVLKVDIEGSEYHLIEHLIKTNAIKYIKNIFVEDHERKIFKQTKFYDEYISKRKFIIEYFEKSDIKYYNWK